MRVIEVKIGGKWVPVVESYCHEQVNGYLLVKSPTVSRSFRPVEWRILED